MPERVQSNFCLTMSEKSSHRMLIYASEQIAAFVSLSDSVTTCTKAPEGPAPLHPPSLLAMPRQRPERNLEVGGRARKERKRIREMAAAGLKAAAL